MNTLSGPMIGPSYGMGPLGGPGLAGLSMDTMGGPLAPGDMMLGTTGFADPISGMLGLGPFGPVSEYGNSSAEPIVEFFEDPSLYDDYRQNQDPPEIENNLNTFLINGSGDFGKTFLILQLMTLLQLILHLMSQVQHTQSLDLHFMSIQALLLQQDFYGILDPRLVHKL